MSELISVIVPIYKVEKYLDRCVESLINQTYKNLEIILVDDGSPDNSPAMCDNYAKKDSRVKVIHLQNGGAGRARNIGFSVSTGNFISFVDGDDLLNLEFYTILLKNFTEQTDIVECDYISFNEFNDKIFNKNNDTVIESSKIYTSADAMREHIYDKKFKQVIWNKIYRRSVVENVYFPEKSKIDDEFWTYKVIGNSRLLVHINSVLYAYRHQENSVMHNLTTNDRIKTIEPRLERALYIKNKYPELYNDALYSLWCSCLYQYQLILRSDNNSDYFYKYCKDILAANKLKIHKLKQISIKEKIWMMLLKLSLKGVCNLRNFLKIGY